MVFRYFFKQQLYFLAMMCVKVCLHMFLLQINQIHKIKHSESVSRKQKTRFVCNIHWKSGFGQFSLDPALYYATPCPMFSKMVLNRAQGLNKKSHEVSARKNSNRLRYNKNVEGVRVPPPGSFRVKKISFVIWLLITKLDRFLIRIYIKTATFNHCLFYIKTSNSNRTKKTITIVLIWSVCCGFNLFANKVIKDNMQNFHFPCSQHIQGLPMLIKYVSHVTLTSGRGEIIVSSFSKSISNVSGLVLYETCMLLYWV